ncbi:hypothetical protein [Endozoicomonas sp. ALC020]|uniref:hypothetical protein n=1 Tax=unclassified Endozoicomonas TaxID=2644528 RepID=UPI003BB20BD4
MIYHSFFKPSGKDRIIKHSLFAVTLLLLLSLSVFSQTEPGTGRFIVRIERTAGYQKQNFSIKPDRRALSGTPSDIADTISFAGSDSLLDDKGDRLGTHGVKTPHIESISWQLLYVTNLLASFEPIQTTKDVLQSPYSHLCLPVEIVIAVSWLLKGCWPPDSSLFNPIEPLIEQQEASQNQPFMITTVMIGPEHQQQQSQPSDSTRQQSSGTTIPYKGSFTPPMNSGSGDGEENPQQHSHTFGFNCFTNPCHGICLFRPSSDNGEPDEWLVNSIAKSCPHLAGGNCFSCIDHFHSQNTKDSRESSHFGTLDDLFDIQRHYDFDLLFELPTHDTGSNFANSCNPEQSAIAGDNHTTAPDRQKICDAIVTGKDGRQQPCQKVCKNARILSSHKARAHNGQRTCEVTVFGKDGQPQPCGKVLKNTQSLSSHKNRYHSGQKTCDVYVIGEDGQKRPCGTNCKNAQVLTIHKKQHHTGQQTCSVLVEGMNKQLQQCGTICLNAQALQMHKSNHHSEQKTCRVFMVGEDGQTRSCGKIFKNNRDLCNHKKKDHSKQQTCDLTVQGKNGQPQPCGKVCKNAKALTDHKSRGHSGQQTCATKVIGKDGQAHPCGKICKNARVLRYHKLSAHTSQQTCEVKVVGENGEPQPCGKVCKNAKALTDHKRRHRKRKRADVDQEDKLDPRTDTHIFVK